MQTRLESQISRSRIGQLNMLKIVSVYFSFILPSIDDQGIMIGINASHQLTSMTAFEDHHL